MRVYITELLPGDRLTADTFNGYGLHVLSKGTLLNSEEISLLLRHQIEYVDIEPRQTKPSDTTSYENAYKKQIEETVAPLFNEAVFGMKLLFEQAAESGKINEQYADETFKPLAENLLQVKDAVSLLLTLEGNDDYTYQHCVQVGILSYFIAKWKGMDEEQAVLAGKAGYLHDIGKCRISKSILYKPGKLTAQEFEEVKKHTVYGYDIIEQSIGSRDLALVALLHHERCDGSGYPRKLTGDQIHPLAKIVAVADVYSAMISNRVYQEKRDLLYVLKELHRLSFTELDPETTHTFIQHMIPNFIGKQVKLKSGESGTIVMTNPVDFFRPLVRMDDTFIDLSANSHLEIATVTM